MKATPMRAPWISMTLVWAVLFIGHAVDAWADAGGRVTQMEFIQDFQTCASDATAIADNRQNDYLPVFRIFGALGAPPPFGGKTKIKAAGTDIKLSYCTVPHVVDWNADGKKDLLVGEFYGNVFLYVNSGTDTNPVFGAGTKLQAGGSEIKVPSG